MRDDGDDLLARAGHDVAGALAVGDVDHRADRPARAPGLVEQRLDVGQHVPHATVVEHQVVVEVADRGPAARSHLHRQLIGVQHDAGAHAAKADGPLPLGGRQRQVGPARRPQQLLAEAVRVDVLALGVARDEHRRRDRVQQRLQLGGDPPRVLAGGVQRADQRALLGHVADHAQEAGPGAVAGAQHGDGRLDLDARAGRQHVDVGPPPPALLGQRAARGLLVLGAHPLPGVRLAQRAAQRLGPRPAVHRLGAAPPICYSQFVVDPDQRVADLVQQRSGDRAGIAPPVRLIACHSAS